jgi:glutathione transport system substrate-binding protein
MEADRLRQGRKFDGYWKPGYPKVDEITWKPVVDNNTRSAMMQTGEAQFTYPLPYEQADLLKSKSSLDVIAASIIQRYMSMNTKQKPFDNPKVREAINYAINKEALVKVAFNGYATPMEGVVPQGVDYAFKTGPWPYDVKKAKALLKEAGYRTVSRPNCGRPTPHHGAEGDPVPAAATGAGRHQGQDQALEAGQRVERVESWQDPATAPVRMSTSAGRRPPVKPTGHCVRCWLRSHAAAPVQHRYKNDKVDADIAKALTLTDRKEKEACTRMPSRKSGRMHRGPSW